MVTIALYTRVTLEPAVLHQGVVTLPQTGFVSHALQIREPFFMISCLDYTHSVSTGKAQLTTGDVSISDVPALFINWGPNPSNV